MKTFCPLGHSWIFVGSTTLYSDYYYCPKCDKIYSPTVREVTEDEVSEQFISKRYDQMKEYALILKAKERVTKGDLIKLGYI